MRALTLFSTVALTASLMFVSAQSDHLSTSYYQTLSLLISSGHRIFTTVSVPVVFTIGQSTTSNNAAPTGGGGGGNSSSTQSNGGGGSSNGTQIVGGPNGTASQTSTSTTPSATSFAPTTLDFGGGGTTVAAPTPGGTGKLPMGPGDGYHTGDAIKMGASLVAVVATIGGIVGVQLLWTAT